MSYIIRYYDRVRTIALMDHITEKELASCIDAIYFNERYLDYLDERVDTVAAALYSVINYNRTIRKVWWYPHPTDNVLFNEYPRNLHVETWSMHNVIKDTRDAIFPRNDMPEVYRRFIWEQAPYCDIANIGHYK
jgi:hypothetical protein